MDIKNFIEGLGEKKEELLKKAALCKSAEELMALAVENGISLDKAGAIELFETMAIKTGKLSDEELDNVAGGGIYKEGGRLLVTAAYGCGYWNATTERLWLAIKGQCGSCSYYGGDSFKMGTCGNRNNNQSN